MNDTERFWSHVDRTGGPEACWPYTGSRQSKGYGKAWFAGRKTGAHRVAFAIANGDIPAGLLVCHHCDNPPCCNPSHLFLGTAKDNAHDSMAKGRWRVANYRSGVCRRGHPIRRSYPSEANRSRCVTCHYDAQKRRRAAALTGQPRTEVNVLSLVEQQERIAQLAAEWADRVAKQQVEDTDRLAAEAFA